MQYLSPSTFTGETISGPLDKKAIQLGRKKLFAELELSGETTIDLQGKPFTKNDIIKYFDDLLKEDALTYHSAIGDDPVLLGFLEHSGMGKKEKFGNNPLYKEEQFIQWVSPYFCHSFAAFTKGCFQQPDEDGMTSLMSNSLLMTPGDTEKAWNTVIRIIMDNIATLERFIAQDKKRKAAGSVTPAQLKALMEFNYIRMIQLLPQGRFAPIRDKYAYCMMNACIDVFNANVRNRSYARNWMENAILLAVSPNVKDQLSKKLQEMESLGMPEPGRGVSNSSSSSSSTAPWKIVLIIIIAIARIATCRSDSSSSSSYYYKSQNSPIYKIDQHLFDSLMHSQEGTTEVEPGSTTPIKKAVADTPTFIYKIKRHPKHK
ncbi:hypothetical protein A3860_19995 [Niastella vici]|uniref:Uncharacterized protein n=1 Tax=Niastella vici TaxID=1703345 RepID=A0A1V9G0W4_9BACT|nr:hypothetical protein [Niastella vici]OQP64261.1 hypothetical protein A3860_19995 [Niastella vici]